MYVGLPVVSCLFTEFQQLLKVLNLRNLHCFEALYIRSLGRILPELQIGSIVIEQIIDLLIVYLHVAAPECDLPSIFILFHEFKDLLDCPKENSLVALVAQHSVSLA